MDFTATLHQATCYFMTGVIWMIQSLHYPAFAAVATDQFETFHRRHTGRMTFVAGPAMLIELATGLALARCIGSWWWLDLGAVGALFVSTFALSVPLHDRLARGSDAALIRRLVRTNWPRTALWTVRSLVFLVTLRA